MMGTIATIVLFAYWTYGCYVYFRIRPHWNETVAYNLRCRAERKLAALEENGEQSESEMRELESDEAELIFGEEFRSIPFSTIPARFKLAKLLDSVPDAFDARSKGDYTQWGYAYPQVEQSRDAGGEPLGEDDLRQYDEFACLNCTITAPRAALEGGLKNLPVMVYLHGGASFEGCCNISASHDTTRMVALSVEEDMPVVIVSLHYRLNWFGFFTSTDLLDEARNNGDGFVANLGLRDQRLGFQWVQQQVAGFGGDRSNVTAFGESGGSISLTHHLCAGEPLFQRKILQSGILEAPDGGLKERDAMYERLLNYLGIDESAFEAKLAGL